MMLPEHTSVAIVGAGPSGLMMAAQLLRQGLHPLIIDTRTSPVNESRACAIHARSLEILNQLGTAGEFIKEGNIVNSLAFHHGSDEAGQLNISDIGNGKSPFPYVLMLPQNRTERLLLNYLTAHACPVFWNTCLLDLHQTDERVFLKVKHNDEEKYITADWLVGADGAGSKVRKSLKIDFSGGSYPHHFFVADLAIPHGFDSSTANVSYSQNSFVAIFPLGHNTFRFLGVLPETLKGREGLTFEDVSPYLTYSLDYPIDKGACHWFSTYHLHHRLAGRFQERRCFLTGDAAHIHSPLGGQGMNTGLQDAYNLSWKLAGVIKNEFDVKVLKTYSEERMPVAQRLLQTTDRLFSIATSRNWFIRKARNRFLPILVRWYWKQEQARQNVFSLLSQTGISYRSSSLSVHHSPSKKIQAGDRLPYLPLYDEKQKIKTDLHQWFNKTGFSLLILGELNSRSLLAMSKWIKLNYPHHLNLYYLPHSANNQNIFDCFEVKEKQRKAVIVRPDLHIGYINDIVDVELIDGYLKGILG